MSRKVLVLAAALILPGGFVALGVIGAAALYRWARNYSWGDR